MANQQADAKSKLLPEISPAITRQDMVVVAQRAKEKRRQTKPINSQMSTAVAQIESRPSPEIIATPHHTEVKLTKPEVQVLPTGTADNEVSVSVAAPLEIKNEALELHQPSVLTDDHEQQHELEVAAPDTLNFVMTEHGLAYLPVSDDESAAFDDIDRSETISLAGELVNVTVTNDSESYLEAVDTPNVVDVSEASQRPIEAPAELQQAVKELVADFFVAEQQATAEGAVLFEHEADLQLAPESIIEFMPQALRIEQLEATLVAVFQTLEIEPTKKNIRIFIQLVRQELQAETIDTLGIEYLSRRIGTSEFQRIMRQALSSIQHVSQQIGRLTVLLSSRFTPMPLTEAA